MAVLMSGPLVRMSLPSTLLAVYIPVETPCRYGVDITPHIMRARNGRIVPSCRSSEAAAAPLPKKYFDTSLLLIIREIADPSNLSFP